MARRPVAGPERKRHEFGRQTRAARSAVVERGGAFGLRGVLLFRRPQKRVRPGREPSADRGATRERDQAPRASPREVRLKADSREHFVFEAAINDRPATFMADTGATLVLLTYEYTALLGLSAA